METEYMNRFVDEIWPLYWRNLPVNEFELNTYLKIVHNIRIHSQFDDNTAREFICLLQLIRHTISNVKYADIGIDDIISDDDDALYCCLRIEDDLRLHIEKHKGQ